MAEHNLIGQRGETLACRFLMQKGYTLIERNWKSNHHEIDIIALHYGLLVFVEVKTLIGWHHEEALVRVDAQKMKNLIQAANEYIRLKHLRQPMRFDTITITGKEPNMVLNHSIGAFPNNEYHNPPKWP